VLHALVLDGTARVRQAGSSVIGLM